MNAGRLRTSLQQTPGRWHALAAAPGNAIMDAKTLPEWSGDDNGIQPG